MLKSYGASGAKPLVGISVREWRCWTHYKDIIAQAADQIVEEFDARVVFLPMQYPEDVVAAERIALRTKEKSIVLNDEYTTSELLSIVGNLDLLIGIRLHALIFAGVMGVPVWNFILSENLSFFAINWRRCGRGFGKCDS